MSNNDCSTKHQYNKNDALSQKFDKVSGKAVAIGVSVLLGLLSILYTDVKSRLDALEIQSSFLHQDKLSRSEFKSEMRDLRDDMLISKKDTDNKIDAVRNDIIDRINMVLEVSRNKNN